MSMFDPDGEPPSVSVTIRAPLSSKGKLDALRQGVAAEDEVVYRVFPTSACWDRTIDLEPEFNEYGDAELVANRWRHATIDTTPHQLVELMTVGPVLWYPFPAISVEVGEPCPLNEYPSLERLLEIEEGNRRGAAQDAELLESALPEKIKEWESRFTTFVETCRAAVEDWKGPNAEGEQSPDVDALADRLGALVEAAEPTAEYNAKLANVLQDVDDGIAEWGRAAFDRRAKEKAQREAEEWVPEHGSSRLRKAMSLGLLDSSMTVYRDERLQKEHPGWTWMRPTGGKLRSILNPQEPDLDLLIEARKWDPSAMLQWYSPSEIDKGHPVVVARFLGRRIMGNAAQVAEATSYDFDEEPF